MKRAMFAVKLKGENHGHCANNLTVYDGEGGRQALAFISSGRLVTVPVDQVDSVVLSGHWSHCVNCDGPVSHLSYDPVNERPKAQA